MDILPTSRAVSRASDATPRMSRSNSTLGHTSGLPLHPSFKPDEVHNQRVENPDLYQAQLQQRAKEDWFTQSLDQAIHSPDWIQQDIKFANLYFALRHSHCAQLKILLAGYHYGSPFVSQAFSKLLQSQRVNNA